MVIGMLPAAQSTRHSHATGAFVSFDVLELLVRVRVWIVTLVWHLLEKAVQDHLLVRGEV